MTDAERTTDDTDPSDEIGPLDAPIDVPAADLLDQRRAVPIDEDEVER